MLVVASRLARRLGAIARTAPLYNCTARLDTVNPSFSRDA
jgi:hypothetical protein